MKKYTLDIPDMIWKGDQHLISRLGAYLTMESDLSRIHNDNDRLIDGYVYVQPPDTLLAICPIEWLRERIPIDYISRQVPIKTKPQQCMENQSLTCKD